MASRNYQCRTLLEYLPTEIILEIFNFLRLPELITAFFGLNSHIDSIIRSVRRASHVVRHNDTDTLRLLQLFPRQIAHLLVVNVEMIDFTSCITLRSLTLKYGTNAQLDSIRPQNFPILEILHLKGLHSTVNGQRESINSLFQVILSNGFLRLRICTAIEIGALEFNNTWTGSAALHTLNLNMKTAVDGEQLHAVCPQLRRFTTYDSSIVLDPTKAPNGIVCKRHCTELRKLERLELENKFILDFNSLAIFGNKQPPPRFNGTTRSQRPHAKQIVTFQGRILPRAEPYCRASFLIEIQLPSEYPFKTPDVRFLDPIYHPHVDDQGCHYCCPRHLLCNEEWKPTTTLATVIESTIDVIDNISGCLDDPLNPTITDEYRSDREKFYRKALACTLSFGRSRE